MASGSYDTWENVQTQEGQILVDSPEKISTLAKVVLYAFAVNSPECGLDSWMLEWVFTCSVHRICAGTGNKLFYP